MTHEEHGIGRDKPTEVDGFPMGVHPPPDGQTVPVYEGHRFLGYKAVPPPPFKIGSIVSKGVTRPADIGQLWVVVGLAFSHHAEGHWKATVARRGTTEFHRNSLYYANALFLRLVA